MYNTGFMIKQQFVTFACIGSSSVSCFMSSLLACMSQCHNTKVALSPWHHSSEVSLTKPKTVISQTPLWSLGSWIGPPVCQSNAQIKLIGCEQSTQGKRAWSFVSESSVPNVSSHTYDLCWSFFSVLNDPLFQLQCRLGLWSLECILRHLRYSLTPQSFLFARLLWLNLRALSNRWRLRGLSHPRLVWKDGICSSTALLHDASLTCVCGRMKQDSDTKSNIRVCSPAASSAGICSVNLLVQLQW